jgi:sugar phosphate isomerase/epimerase
MRIGFITDLSETDFRFAADNGFPCVEHVSFGDVDIVEQKEDIRRLKQTYGVDFSMLALFVQNYISDSKEIAEESFRQARALIDLCHEIEAPLMVTCPGEGEDRSLQENAARAVDAFGELIDYGRPRGVNIALYNCHVTNFAYAPAAWELILPALPDLSLKFDPSHPLYDGRDYLAELRDWGSRVAHVHAKGSLVVGGERFEDPPAGMDDTRWGPLFAVLYHHDYAGDINIEPHAATWTGKRRHDGILLARRHLSQFVV